MALVIFQGDRMIGACQVQAVGPRVIAAGDHLVQGESGVVHPQPVEQALPHRGAVGVEEVGHFRLGRDRRGVTADAEHLIAVLEQLAQPSRQREVPHRGDEAFGSQRGTGEQEFRVSLRQARAGAERVA